MKLNVPAIIHILGLLTALNGFFMLFAIPVSLYYHESVMGEIGMAGGISMVTGALMWFVTRKKSRVLKKKEGYLIVTLGWIILTVTGTLPYVFTGAIPEFTDAFFETMSGYTTTGASILTDIEVLPKGILFWRSITHWIGGMGIIVLAIAILPILGIGGMQLFLAESPGPSADKLTPRIQDTAKRLWILYVILTVVETVLLMFGGMDLFESLCHSMATVSTGGFSTRNASVAAYESPYIQYVIIIFMFLGGVNFTLSYFTLIKRNFKKAWKSEEFRTYTGLVIFISLVMTLIIYFGSDAGGSFEKAWRDSLFQSIAVITTTGFVTADFTQAIYPGIMTIILFVIMFMGGSAGSTGGGIKIVRHIIVAKTCFIEFRKQIHPNAIIPVRLDGNAVHSKITYNILAFFLIYFGLFGIGSLVMGALGSDFATAIGSSASALGNIGPGLGEVCPFCNYAGLPAGSKWFLSFLMMVGRLELFTVLILMTPYYWRRT
ncbi:MAG: TrkH family potassium uptake protein [Bacteroidia bacterium]|nr:TrkH family potassium uptake protein [Bacteroidia bacterium]